MTPEVQPMSLFDPIEPTPGAVHQTDPETSVSASQSRENRERWGSQRVALLAAYRGRSDGLTPDAAGRLASVEGYSQRRRCSELERDRLLEATGDIIEGQRVLRITPKGEAALRSAKPPKDKESRDYSGAVMRPSTKR